MPAQDLRKTRDERIYCHIYNRGATNGLIFKDNDDYDVFLSYLSQYLSLPSQRDVTIKTFTVRGRTFQGTPHQPKNYFNQMELVAYSLKPNHFHLVLYQVEENALEYFIRSLCTRYSIYFNKKYKCSGSLFEGPYKSIKIDDLGSLALLTRYIHLHSDSNHAGSAEYRSSYPEYLGTRTTSWVKPDVVLALFDKSKNNSFKGLSSYRSFVESYEPDPQETTQLEKIAIENIEGSKNKNSNADVKVEGPIEEPTPIVVSTRTKNKTSKHFDLNLISRTSVFAIIFFVFVFLFSYGYRNVQTSQTSLAYVKTSDPSPTPSVKGVSETPEVEKPLKTLVIKAPEGFSSVNIRSNPTASSELIGTAKEGDTFEYISLESGWYGVKMENGVVGYIFAEYLNETGGTN